MKRAQLAFTFVDWASVFAFALLAVILLVFFSPPKEAPESVELVSAQSRLDLSTTLLAVMRARVDGSRIASLVVDCSFGVRNPAALLRRPNEHEKPSIENPELCSDWVFHSPGSVRDAVSSFMESVYPDTAWFLRIAPRDVRDAVEVYGADNKYLVNVRCSELARQLDARGAVPIAEARLDVPRVIAEDSTTGPSVGGVWLPSSAGPVLVVACVEALA